MQIPLLLPRRGKEGMSRPLLLLPFNGEKAGMRRQTNQTLENKGTGANRHALVSEPVSASPSRSPDFVSHFVVHFVGHAFGPEFDKVGDKVGDEVRGTTGRRPGRGEANQMLQKNATVGISADTNQTSPKSATVEIQSGQNVGIK